MGRTARPRGMRGGSVKSTWSEMQQLRNRVRDLEAGKVHLEGVLEREERLRPDRVGAAIPERPASSRRVEERR